MKLYKRKSIIIVLKGDLLVMKKKILSLILVVVFIYGNAFANEAEFNKAVSAFAGSIIGGHVYKSGENYGIIKFIENPKFPDYYTTGDKINKIFAIESARLFRKVPSMKTLGVQIVSAGKDYRMTISRKQIETWYSLNFANMSIEDWRNKFVQKYDNKKLRSIFSKKFVKINR